MNFYLIYILNLKMDIEPLPKVTFLPAQLTELVIKNWTGDIIDYEKNGQVRVQPNLIFLYRFAKFTMGKELASLETDTPTRESLSMVFFTAKVHSNGLTVRSTVVNSPPTRSLAPASTSGQTAASMKAKS